MRALQGAEGGRVVAADSLRTCRPYYSVLARSRAFALRVVGALDHATQA